MKRRRLFGLALVALALAGVVSLGVFRLLRRATAAKAVTTPVVVAAVPLAAGATIGTQDVTVLNLPPQPMPLHVFHTVKEVEGRVLTSALVPNQMVVAEMVAKPGEGVGLPPLIPPGMRAVSVKVNDVVSVAGFAVPGTHVDVLLTGNPTSNSDPRLVTTVTLLANVQVLTAGERMEQSQDGKPEKVTVITLLVTPEGAEKLALADGYGHIQLALRNPLDQKAPETLPVLNARLYQDGAAAAPAPARRADPPKPAPPPEWAVVLISGDKHQTVNFPRAAALP